MSEQDESWFLRFIPPNASMWILPDNPIGLVQRHVPPKTPSRAITCFGGWCAEDEQVYPTTPKNEVINVTEQLAQMISDVKNCLVLFHVPYTPVALILCEDDEELRQVLIFVTEKVLADLRPFKHNRENNPNAEAHILSAMAGSTVTLAIEERHLSLSTYSYFSILELAGSGSVRVAALVFSA